MDIYGMYNSIEPVISYNLDIYGMYNSIEIQLVTSYNN